MKYTWYRSVCAYQQFDEVVPKFDQVVQKFDQARKMGKCCDQVMPKLWPSHAKIVNKSCQNYDEVVSKL